MKRISKGRTRLIQTTNDGLAGGFGDGAPAHVRVIASELRL
jgi:hypothetical protein